jgi:hypothetical protein
MSINCPVHITLTLDECDAIDAAKSRIRRLASLLSDLIVTVIMKRTTELNYTLTARVIR